MLVMVVLPVVLTTTFAAALVLATFVDANVGVDVIVKPWACAVPVAVSIKADRPSNASMPRVTPAETRLNDEPEFSAFGERRKAWKTHVDTA